VTVCTPENSAGQLVYPVLFSVYLRSMLASLITCFALHCLSPLKNIQQILINPHIFGNTFFQYTVSSIGSPENGSICSFDIANYS